ncbi:MAG TPA: tryptophan 2,3-dioxygenase family protein [Gaiellaceae bacterium]|nr:tryptophan 2,3-dioxygenase family protein [Gaiellaceae bacterium]
MSRREQTGLEDELGPVLPGLGASDYERYIRTDELLSLQKTEDERAHHDELLFQVTHQSSELWLKLGSTEVDTATGQIGAGELRAASRSLRRAVLCLKLITEQLDMLEMMSPWEYTSGVRPELGHGSGFDSPGWNHLRQAIPPAGEAFHRLRRADGLSLADVYRQARDHEDLAELAETLTELDERAGVWRIRHLRVVERIIGGEVVGTQGTPVELLAGLVHRKFFPELWDVRNELTGLAKAEEA